MKFFRSGQLIAYNGGRKARDIVKWVEKKTTPLTIILNTPEDLKKLNEANDVNIIAYFNDEDHVVLKNIMSIAEDLDGYGYKFGITNKKDVLATEYEIEDEGVYMFKEFEDKPSKYTMKSFEVSDLKFFIHNHALPTSTIEFNTKLPPRIFASINPALYLIVSSAKSEEYKAQKEIARKLAEDYKRKINIVLLDVEIEINMGFLDFFLGFKKQDAPGMRLIHGMQDKYDPEPGSFTEEKAKKYIADRIGGKGVGWTTSEKIPEDWDKNPVKVLVAKNFHEVVENKKNVFVEFYAPWCGHCKALAPIWEEVGEMLKDRDDIWIAKMDNTVNQIDSIRVPGYPSLLLFQGTHKTNIPFKGERSLERILDFLEEHGVKMKDNEKKDEL